MSVAKARPVLEDMSREDNDLMLPDAIFNIKQGEVLLRVKGNSYGGPGAEYDGWGVVEVGEDALPVFALYLTSIFRLIQLREGDTAALLASILNNYILHKLRTTGERVP